MKKIFYILFIAIISFRCSDDNSITSAEVAIEKALMGLEVKNRIASPLYYFVVDKNASFLIDWIPTVGEDTPSISPYARKNIPFEDIIGFENDSETVIFYYWKAVEVNGELTPGPVSFLEVDF